MYVINSLKIAKIMKINHAYSNGKAANALNVLNRNLDLNITDYVTVDFSIVAQCIDAVGGIEIELEEKEIIIEETFTENLPITEDWIRDILPKICMLAVVLIVLKQLIKKK